MPALGEVLITLDGDLQKLPCRHPPAAGAAWNSGLRLVSCCPPAPGCGAASGCSLPRSPIAWIAGFTAYGSHDYAVRQASAAKWWRSHLYGELHRFLRPWPSSRELDSEVKG